MSGTETSLIVLRADTIEAYISAMEASHRRAIANSLAKRPTGCRSSTRKTGGLDL